VTNQLTSEAGVDTETVVTRSRGVNGFTPNLSASYSVTPGFDYEILDSQDFYRGILSPISTDTLVHYMLQGWPSELISSLVIERFTIVEKSSEDDKSPKITRLDNNPVDPKDMEKFRAFIACLNIEPKELKGETILFPKMKRSDIRTLGDIEIFNSRAWGFENDTPNSALKLSRPRTDTLSITPSKCVGNAVLKDMPDFNFLKKFENEDGTFLSSYSVTNEDDTFRHNSNVTVVSADKKTEIRIVTRSIHGVIYYLGECLRARNEGCFYQDGEEKKLVSNIRQTQKQDSAAPVTASLYGKTYEIPADVSDADRTFQSLAFVNQMLNLQKTASASPSTSTVRLVN